jgi:hypothetical protein
MTAARTEVRRRDTGGLRLANVACHLALTQAACENV